MEEIPEDELHLLLTEVDTNKNGLIELDEVGKFHNSILILFN
jgi:hypothetical protein